MSERAATMLDIAFPVQGGGTLPRAHRSALAAALETALPWLAEEPSVAVHRLNLSAGGGALGLLSGRTRLTLRVPRHREADARALSGCTLAVAGQALRLGTGHVRELLPFGTQYAHFVAAAPGAAAEGDEQLFLDQVQAELAALGIAGRAICGRRQGMQAGDHLAALSGYGLMLDGLQREAALRLLEAGLGAHRRWGCGVFVPHKSAAAVGAAH
ncbi:MAG: type I-MYXAN CRISPR-associated protein Cas6/Cmx6 [Rubrivivax sp.]|nr:type I-MYXAN CRISPR-associated protein Cas6/Cmx6 [Rubrivivax sp.]